MTIKLNDPIRRILRETGATRASIAFRDHETGTNWSHGGSDFYHAASTIKVAILMGVYALIEEGVLEHDSPVRLHNRFLSLADGRAFAVESSRDSCPQLHDALGQTLPLSELAYHMIVTSSNLATNLLIDLAGIEALQDRLRRMDVDGVELRRGVEDEAAFEAGINNRVTAHGLQRLFDLLYAGRVFATERVDDLLRILFDQAFSRGIPMGIPPGLREHTRFAHKTGEISTVTHDAGLVYLPERKPYSLVVLTEHPPGQPHSRRAIRRLSRLVYRRFISPD